MKPSLKDGLQDLRFAGILCGCATVGTKQSAEILSIEIPWITIQKFGK